MAGFSFAFFLNREGLAPILTELVGYNIMPIER